MNKETFNDIDKELFKQCKKFLPSLQKDDSLVDTLSLMLDEIKKEMERVRGKV